MKDVFVVHAKRTAIGRFAGSLSSVRVDDLLAHLFSDFLGSCGFDPALIDDVIVGNANGAGEDNRNLARMGSILSGLPFEVPGVTVNRLCGSSLDAVITASLGIQTGYNDCVIVGGAESMSRAPYVMSKADSPFGRGQKMWDTSIGWRFPNPKMEKMFPLYGMGETAEEVASLHKISREDQDEFAYNSHQKALKADFSSEILPIEVQQKKNSFTFDKDEGPRADTSLEKLAKLRPAFRENGSVTAGNSSSINDGAAMVVVCSEDFVKKHNLNPLGRISGFGVRGCHPNTMGLGPIFATHTLCQKFNKKISDFEIVELNEAFAAQSLACIRELKIDPSIVNQKGGAISLGHPLGCSGARILTTLIYQMREKNLTQGLATMCIGVGQGIAVSVERT